MSECVHCGMSVPEPPITSPTTDAVFCCQGCLEVYRIVRQFE
jgi:hypothetical protein